MQITIGRRSYPVTQGSRAPLAGSSRHSRWFRSITTEPGTSPVAARCAAGLMSISVAPAVHAACAAGATLIDIRPAAQRAAAGEIPGSVVIERNHLEWRLDPASDARLPWVTGYDLRPIVICAEGYTSSLAASALKDLGFAQATDVAGGYQAWQKAGLPTALPDERTVVIAPGASPAFRAP